MVLYMGNEKLKIHLGKDLHSMNIGKPLDLIFNGIVLKSSDGFMLKDSNGLRLIAKKEDE